MTQPNNRRHFWRAHFQSPVQLTVDGQHTAAELHDISLKGALVSLAGAWNGRQGDRCHLHLPLAQDIAIDMDATVAHVDGPRIGLHCDSIDLDSVTHLRRLVGLNSGDPDILDRELAALLKDAAD